MAKDNDEGGGTATAERPTKREPRSVAERLQRTRAVQSLKKGEHMLDLVLYRNKTKVPQVVMTDDGLQITLLPAGFTGKSMSEAERNNDVSMLKKFPGGTVVLTRKRGMKLAAANIVQEIEVVDRAVEGDFENEKT